jgi:FkbM family methyltransferase
MEDKLFWTLTPEGLEVLRNLKKENETFTIEKYYEGYFDANNYQWFEMFHHYVYDDFGCDYERYGCFIKEGDVVLDLGANIGVFAHRAEMRGASKVISFEPISKTYNCLIKNAGPKTITYQNAVGGENKFQKFLIHTDYSRIGGASSLSNIYDEQNTIHTEVVYTININDVFDSYNKKIDFMKIDIEGGEIEVLNSISDDNILSLRCLSAEFHNISEGFEEFQHNFVNRIGNLGFKYFILYHGDGILRTLNFWKDL